MGYRERWILGDVLVDPEQAESHFARADQRDTTVRRAFARGMRGCAVYWRVMIHWRDIRGMRTSCIRRSPTIRLFRFTA